MAPSISACLIVRDEEVNLPEALATIRGHVDEIIVVDTGSTDHTREMAVRAGASFYEFNARTNPEAFFTDDAETCHAFGAPPPFSGEVALGNFAAARNESFRHATSDYVYWLDADDRIEGAEHLRFIISQLAQAPAGTWPQPVGFLKYDYAIDHLGRVFYSQWRERIFRRGIANWLNPVHEVLMPAGQIMPVQFQQVVHKHHRKADRKTIPNRNYKLLLRELHRVHAANPTAPIDPRTLFYLGQESRFIEPLRAVGFYEKYLQSSGWPEERAAAHNALGHIYEFGQAGLPPEEAYARANKEYAVAAAETVNNPDGLLGLARIAYHRARHQDCVNYTERALAIGNTDSMLGMNPADRTYRPHVYYNHSLHHLGRTVDAIKSCEAGLAAFPDDPGVPGGASGMLSLNLQIYKDILNAPKQLPAHEGKPVVNIGKDDDPDAPANPAIPQDAVIIWGIQLCKQNVAAGDGDRARAVLDAMPRSVANDPAVQRMRDAVDRKFPAPTLTNYEGARGYASASSSRVERTSPPEPLAFEDIPVRRPKRGLTHFPNPNRDEDWEPARPRKKAIDRLVEGGVIAKPLSIVFYLGPGPEPWDPRTPNEKGLGGSETAAIEMAKNFAKLGHKVEVIAEADGVFDDVTYTHYSHHHGSKGRECDVFIASRAPWAIHVAPLTARLKILWVHDIHVGTDNGSIAQFDRILCLSQWHRTYFLQSYPQVDPGKVAVTRNGIDPLRFSPHELFGMPMGGQPAKKNHLVFSSSPNRGLDHLLYNFRQVIKPRVPDAELHVFYGFDTWEQIAQRNNSQAELAEIARFRSLLPPLGGNAGGVFNHGKRPQSEVAAAYMRSKVWLYHTGFPETYCISALEAQAAGCVPVCSAFAGLNETVKHGFKVPNEDPEAAFKLVETAIRLMLNENERAPIAQAARSWALTQSWEALAREWSEMFHEMVGVRRTA